MDKEKALAKAKKDYANAVIAISSAAEIADKISPQLPKGWVIKWDIGMTGIEILRGESYGAKINTDINPREFAAVCGLVKMATGHKVSRRVWTDGGSFYCLYGECDFFLEPPNRQVFITIEIRQYQLPENCTIEYTKKRKTVTEAKVVGACLGMMGKENNGG